MAEIQSQFGKLEAWNDFLAPQGDLTWGTGVVELGGGVAMVSVNEGTINDVADEGGGVLQFLTDTGDNDNVCLLSGKFEATEGAVMEARFKVADDLGVGIFAGFSETMALDTPVVPAEFATATMTYNGSGGMVGAQYDDDGTTDGWRAVMGDGGAAVASSANGILSTATAPSADEWQIVRAHLNPDGSGEVYVDGKLIKKFTAGLTATDLFYAVLIVENRTAAAREVEVDYFYARGNRDWNQ
jgi:hypothetical protein